MRVLTDAHLAGSDVKRLANSAVCCHSSAKGKMWLGLQQLTVSCSVKSQLVQVRNLSGTPEMCRHVFPSADVTAGAVRRKMDSRSVVTQK